MTITWKAVFCWFVVLGHIAVAASYSFAEEASASPSLSTGGLVSARGQDTASNTKASGGEVRIGDISIDKENRSVTFPVRVNMNKGLLEYLLVNSGGKTYESLLRTEVRPYDIHVALLLLGLKGTDRPLQYQGSPEIPQGEPLDITVALDNQADKSATFRPEEWIVVNKGGELKKSGPLKWVFTGSMIIDGDFVAQRDGSIVSIFHDPVSIIDNASSGGENDKIWHVKESSVPPVGTPLIMTIKSIK